MASELAKGQGGGWHLSEIIRIISGGEKKAEASPIELFLLWRCGILGGVPLPALQMLQLALAACEHKDFSSKFVKFARLSIKVGLCSEASCAGGMFFPGRVGGGMLLYVPGGLHFCIAQRAINGCSQLKSCSPLLQM